MNNKINADSTFIFFNTSSLTAQAAESIYSPVRAFRIMGIFFAGWKPAVQSLDQADRPRDAVGADDKVGLHGRRFVFEGHVYAHREKRRS